MRTRNKYGDLGSYASRYIKRKASEIVKLEGFTESDREDIEQDLAIEVLRRKPKFDARKAKYDTFVARVVDHAARHMIEKCWAMIRNPRRCECSLNELIPDGEGGLVERAETLDHDTYLRRAGMRPEAELRNLRLELARALETLPPGLRRLCEMLMDNTPAEVARQLGVCRATVTYRMKKVRAHFEGMGLGEYFENPSNDRKALR